MVVSTMEDPFLDRLGAAPLALGVRLGFLPPSCVLVGTVVVLVVESWILSGSGPTWSCSSWLFLFLLRTTLLDTVAACSLTIVVVAT